MNVGTASILVIVVFFFIMAYLLEHVLLDSKYFVIWTLVLTVALFALIVALVTLKPISSESTPITTEVVVFDEGRFAVVDGEKYRVVYSYVEKPQFVYKKYGFPWEVHKLELQLPMPKYNAE